MTGFIIQHGGEEHNQPKRRAGSSRPDLVEPEPGREL